MNSSDICFALFCKIHVEMFQCSRTVYRYTLTLCEQNCVYILVLVKFLRNIGVNCMDTSEAAKEAVTEVSSAWLSAVLFIVSKFSLQVLIRVQHQKAFKEEGRRAECLYGPGQA